MSEAHDYFEVESRGSLGILWMKPAFEEAVRFAEDMSRKPRGLLQSVVKATALLHANIETYLDKLGGGFTALPPE